MSGAGCPAPVNLERLFLGGLPEPEVALLEQHVLACATCLEQLKTLLRSKETLAGMLTDETGNEALPSSPAVDDLMSRLESLPSVAELSTVQPSDRREPPTAPVSDAATPLTEPPTRPDTTCELAPGGPVDITRLTEFLAPKQADDELGRLGKYRILAILGHGGMGVVYKAEDPKLERVVAIKAMLPALAASESAGQRFLREAQAIAKVEHDHIVRVYQVDEDRGVPYLAMEFLKGEPLDARLKREPMLPLPEVLRIGREIAEALAAAHGAGLIHRDIKPANIWLEDRSAGPGAAGSPDSHLPPPGPRVKLIDFGLARGSAEESGLTQKGIIIGTPAYMAPEQGRGARVDARCDLWSLGVVLYRLSTGQVPFQGSDTISTLLAAATIQPEPPARLNPAIPADLSALVMSLLEKDPAQRPASARAVVRALRYLEQGRRANGERVTTPEEARTAALKRRRTPLLLALGAALVALATLGVMLFWQTPHGLVRIESNEPGVEIVFDRTGPSIKGADPKPIALEPGEHGVLVKWDGRTFETDRLALKKGQTVALRVEFLKGTLQVTADGRDLGARDMAGAEAAGPPALALEKYTNPVGMELVRIPRGKAWLGGSSDKPGDREVEIKEDFYLGIYEVTQEEWHKVLRATPSWFARTGGGKDVVQDVSDAELKRFPVEQVSWQDAQLFLERLNALDKQPGWYYRLPTEAEWEYACRGGPSSARAESAFDFYLARPTNRLLPGQANFKHRQSPGRTCKVGSYPPNRLGLHDMHGNLWEWCDDAVLDPMGAPRRVNRGGCWSYSADDCRAVDRYFNLPSDRDPDTGLRVARVPAGKEVRAPDLSQLKPLYQDQFDDPDSGFADNLKTDYCQAGYSNGKYSIKVAADSYRACGNGTRENFVCEVVGRLVRPMSGGWGLYIFAEGPRHGLSIMIDFDGRLIVEPDPADVVQDRGPRIGPLHHHAIRRGEELNTLLVVHRDRHMQIYVNSIAVCEPFVLDRDITPGWVSLGAFGGERGAQAEFTRYTIWSSDDLPK